MPDPVRLFISGYYGYANPGDEAILAVILAELRSRLPDASFTVISGTPEETAKTHGVQAVLWSDPLAIAQGVRDSDLVITGGGGIFHDYGGFPEDGLLTEGNWGLGFHVTAGLLAALFGKPLVIYAVGVGPIFSDAGRRFTRAICEVASAITVRDEGSRQLLEEIGVAPGRVRVTADPAFLLAVPQAGPAAQQRIGVAIRHWAHDVKPEEWEAELASGLDLYLERHGGEVVFLPFQQFPGEQEDDVAVGERVYRKMTRQESARVLRDAGTPTDKAAFLASCHLVVGMRLHSLIFSVKAGVPFVALAYDEKVRQLVERTGRASFAIAMPVLKAELLASKMKESIETRPVDPEPLAMLARANTDLVIEVLAHPSPQQPSRQAMEMLQSAVLALLKTQKELRSWLADQKINYEYQVRLQQEDLNQLRPRLEELKEIRAGLEQSVSGLEQQKAVLEQALAQSEAERHDERRTWESRVDELCLQKATVEEAKAAVEEDRQRLQSLHEQTLADWQGYADETSRRLALYRSQRAWRGMLALRKAYVMLARQGWSGRLRFIPWLFRLMFGGGNLESEQLEFPIRPKPR